MSATFAPRLSGSALFFFRWRRGAAWALIGAALLALGGCGTLQSLSADVSSYTHWPAALKSPAFVFERLPSQQARPDVQQRVEDAARPALLKAGFRPLGPSAEADVLVQVAAESQTVQNGFADPYGRRFDPRFFGGFGGWGGYNRFGFGLSLEPPVTRMQVRVLVRDRRSGAVLYETGASHERAGNFLDALLEPLFAAAMADFPLPAVSPRVVRVPLVADDDFPLIPSAPASAPTPAP